MDQHPVAAARVDEHLLPAGVVGVDAEDVDAELGQAPPLAVQARDAEGKVVQPLPAPGEVAGEDGAVRARGDELDGRAFGELDPTPAAVQPVVRSEIYGLPTRDVAVAGQRHVEVPHEDADVVEADQTRLDARDGTSGTAGLPASTQTLL